ncbi:MAG TPA: PEP-CTERM sorting domain-containing protein [Burkholderiales bacterium]|nr:PEP-CTERM sorting domain-containing protein [Burkholderiales bacterium]
MRRTASKKTRGIFGKLLLASALAGSLHASVAQADFIALDSTRGIGNQAWTGPLGMDFNVVTTIKVTQVGAFDSGQDGFVNAITVGIFNRDTQTLVPLSSYTLTSADTLLGQSRYGDINDVILNVGRYSIVAQGFGSADLNGNTGGGSGGPTIDTGGGAISFVGGARYSGVGAFTYPTIIDGGPSNRYDAGTFQFSVVPEPTSAALVGIALGVLGMSRRRRKS